MPDTVSRLPEPASWGWRQVAIALREVHGPDYAPEQVEAMIDGLKPIYEHARVGIAVQNGSTNEQAIDTIEAWLTNFTVFLMGEIGRRDLELSRYGLDVPTLQMPNI